MTVRFIALILLPFAGLGALQEGSKEETLLAAARKGDLAAVRRLVESGVAVDCKNRYGITPLYYAAWSGHEEIVKYLAGKGADVNVRDTFYKMSALGSAIDKKHDSAASALVRGGSRDAAGLLGMASGRNLTATVSAILETAKPNEAQLSNAVQSAADANHTSLVDLLLKAGAPAPKKLGTPVPPEVLARHVGVYKSPQAGELNVEFTSGKLMLRSTGGTMELLAYDESNFTPAPENMRGMKVEFVTEGGKTKAMKIQQGAFSTVAERVEGKQ